MTVKPYTAGPKELIEHAFDHFSKGSAFDYRIAMISIDNAVELAIKTYLQLPKRIRGTDGPSRREFQDKSSSFPDLLDLLEQYGSDRLNGVSLGDIEVYHRLRNTLYHDGNGVTVDSVHVDSYLQIAKILLNNLLGIEQIENNKITPTSMLGDLVIKWGELERIVRHLANKYLPKSKHRHGPAISIIDGLVTKGLLDGEFRSRLHRISIARNELVHGISIPPENKLIPIINELDLLLNELRILSNNKREYV